MRILASAAAMAFLAGCASLQTASTSPRGPARIPDAPLELGPYRTASISATAADFARIVSRRYGEGVALSAVAADLRDNSFACAAPRDRRGDPPAQLCRRTIRVGECSHSWQVALYAENQGLSRSRGLYDRACRSDGGLLGGN